ncbi:peptide/nickel transport system substrate-binding protein [Nocardioides terrae]|uniref:Peptide/nickel transport system substrate-binding protein n=1 Tax=Nocardioides terrae TaxID=574651 RepID=A0A1I1KF55_9ACTN|nr:ABC transporter substrate-binding protein [Nocardioides terrae]SFC59155.1 peptide/nickel transport system substrate-binding protein [Nocardioides terrae]
MSAAPNLESARNRPRSVAFGLLAVGLALTGSACGVSSSSTSSDFGDTVRIVLPEEPPSLEPCDSSNTGDGVVERSNITEPLTELDLATGELHPLLATEWKKTTPTTYTYTLRSGVKFSDGSAFDAEDAAFSIDRTVNNTELGCFVAGYVFGDEKVQVKAVDATTLTVSTAEPDPILPLRLSFVEMVPSEMSTTEKVREPIGTGPYEIKKWDAGQKLTLAANPKYWGDQPAYKTATYVWRSEGSVRAAMVKEGEADLATQIGPDDGAGDLEVQFPDDQTAALRIQGYIPPLNDMRVRQAINYAIDREGLVKSLFNSDTTIAEQLIPEGITGFNDSLKPWPTDVAKAKQLIAEAKADGVPTSTPIRLVGRSAQFPKIEEIIQVIQKELTEIGLNVKIEMVDTKGSTELQQRPFPKNPGPYLLMIQHGNQAGDAAFSVDQYMLSNGFQSAFGTPELDAMIKSAEKQEGDARQAAFEKVFAYEPTHVGQFAYIAHMTGMMAIASGVDYKPNVNTENEMHLAEMTPKK